MNRNLRKKSDFGVWLNSQKDISMFVLQEASDISYSTISKLCNNPNYLPKFSTIAKMNKGLKELGKRINLNDYFG